MMRKRNRLGCNGNRMCKRVIAFAVAGGLMMSGVNSVYASAISNAQNKKSEAQSDLNSVNNNIKDIEGQKGSLQGEIDALDSQLVTVIATMDMLKGELEDKQTQLDSVTKDLKKAQKKEKKQYKNMKTRIQYLYENGDTNYLEIICGASNFTDFLNRIEYSKQVYDYDRNLLTTYQDTVKQVGDLKQQVEGEKAELEEMQTSYEEQKKEYEGMIAEKKSSMTDFDSKLAQAKDLAQKYQSVIKEQNSVIAKEQKKQEEAAKAAEKTNNKTQNSSNTGKGNGSAATAGVTSGGANPGYSTGTSGSSVANYACQFVGNPYVSGGTSLTNGCDCSGFVMSVYANYGMGLPHSSGALAGMGSEVSYENAQPGDLVCYPGHVAIYIGGGQIVHASNSAPYPMGGIKISSATYRSILTIRRVL